MAQRNRRQVSIRTVDWQKASQLRDKVSRASGRKATITDTIARALGCLESELGRTWLHSERSLVDVEAEQLKIDFVSVLSQFIARTMPERRLCQVTVEPGTVPGGVASVVVHLDDREIPLFMGRVVMSNLVGSLEPVVPTLADFMPAGTGKPIVSDLDPVVPHKVVSDDPLGSDDE